MQSAAILGVENTEFHECLDCCFGDVIKNKNGGAHTRRK